MKFQVGDKVEVILSEHCSLNEVGDMGTITKLGPTDALVIVKERASVVGSNEYGGWHTFDELKLVKPKQTKNQRITALEKEVAELKIIVGDLRERKVIDTTAQVEEEEVTDFPTEPKSANQQRAEIIEKAKKFVEENTKYNGETFSGKKGVKVNPCYIGIPSFKTNEKKRAVTVLFYCVGSGRLLSKGITKCNPSDVYNEHIGKAIALGRALGLDVSEFEQAVQPTFAIGQVVENQNRISNPYSNKPFTVWKVGEKDIYEGPCGWTPSKYLTIINDTNAIYEMEVK